MFRFLKKALILAAFTTFFSGQTYAVNPGWHFLIAPYGWASALSGNTSVLGRTANIHVPFAQILTHMDAAFQGHFEMGYGPWTFMLDPSYLEVSDSDNVRNLGLRFKSKTTLVDSGIFFKAYTKELGNNSDISFEFLYGARFLSLNNSLGLINSDTLSNMMQVLGPIFGARLKWNIHSKWGIWLRGDDGGFGINHLRNTWSSTFGVSYSINQHVELGLAYRVLDFEISKGISNTNLLMYGPMIGIGFQF